MKPLLFKLAGFLACLWHRVPGKFFVLLAQSAHETARWTSKQFVDDRNGFGMTAPTHYDDDKPRQGPEGSVARYTSYWNSWRSRLSWDERRAIKYDPADPLAYMATVQAHGYAADPKYVSKWAAHYNRMSGFAQLWSTNPFVPLAVVSVTLAAILALLWYALKHNKKRR